MHAALVLAAGALVAPALAHNRTEIVTVVSTAYTTYCPGPTTIPIGNVTYTVSKATTLTITNCPCTFTKTGWFKPTPTAQPECPGGDDCGNHGGNHGGDHECNEQDCGSNGGNGGNNGGNGGHNGGNGGHNGGNGGSNGGNGGNNGSNGGNNGGNGGHNGGNPGGNGGSGSQTPAPQGGCDEKTGAGCPADQTAPGAQPTGTSVVIAGANVNGLSAGAMAVAGLAVLML